MNIKATLLTLLLATTQLTAQVSLYDFSTGSEMYTEITGGTILQTATANSGAGSIDDVIFTLPANAIPFTFKFDNVVYNTCRVSSNGFITFGATAPLPSGTTTGFVPLSATTGYNGAASAVGRNLNSYYIAGNPAQTGELRYETIGVAPNRKFVVQYKNFRPFSTGSTFGAVMNFQIRLCEGNDAIEYVYGTFNSLPSGIAQVGLRGPNNAMTHVINRSVVSGSHTWATSVNGTTNTATCAYSGVLIPANGLIYRFAPSLCPPPQNLNAQSAQTTSTLTWSAPIGGGTFTVEYGPSGFTPGTGTIVSGVATSSLNIAGLTPLTAYQFYVTQNCGVNGNSQLSGPRNFSTGTTGEDCLTATTVSVANDSASCSSTLLSSGNSQNGPQAQCSDVTGNTPNDDVWVKFIAPAGGGSIVVRGYAGTVNDWVMQVWRGCPNAGGTVIACSDDENGNQMPMITVCQNQFTPGETLYVRAWTYSSSLTGNFNLCVYKSADCPIPPPNDECLTSILLPVNTPLSCPGSGAVYSTQFATKSGDAAVCQGISQMHDVWFRFNTASYGDLRVTFNKISAANLMAQLRFACGDFEIDCWNPAEGPHVLTGLNPSADYVLRVWSDSIQWGTFSICVEDLCAEPTAQMSGIQTICKGDSIHIPITLTGASPWTFEYTDGVSNFEINTSVSPFYFTVAPQNNTTYQPVSISDIACSGTVSGNTVVNVINKPILSSYTPTNGPSGTNVTLKGKFFTNVVSVRFNNISTSGITIVNDSTITVNVPAGATSGPVSVINQSCTVQGPGIFTVGSVATNFTVNLRLFLEGMYAGGGTMWGSGVLDPAVADSVTLQLAAAVSPYGIIASRTSAVNLNGMVSFQFPSSLLNNSYYFVLRHRNSIETWSKNPILLNSTSQFIDFSVTTP